MGYFKEDRKSQSVLCSNSGIGVVVLHASETTILVLLLLLFLLLVFITVIYYNDQLYMESI
jgi:hypothetical protein